LVALLVGLAIAWIVGFGVAAARLAATRGRSPDLWFAFGAVIGPLAVAIVRAAPPGACGICLSPVPGWEFRCASCGSDVRQAPALARDPALPAGQLDAGPDPHPVLSWLALRPSSVVFLEGSEPLETGATYALAIHGADLRIMGPADSRPNHVVVSRRLGELATTALGDHLIITGTSRTLDGFHIVFTSVQAGTAQELARQLDAERGAVANPTTGLR
jgi:hypothetical protein